MEHKPTQLYSNGLNSKAVVQVHCRNSNVLGATIDSKSFGTIDSFCTLNYSLNIFICKVVSLKTIKMCPV